MLSVFENRVLWSVFTGEKYIMKIVIDLYFSPNITLVIKSRIMRWAGHVARMW
jgi:hypothetical protein